jgi:hypothetical protein
MGLVVSFTLQLLYPSIYWGRGWVGFRAGLGTVEKSLAPAGNRTPIVQSVHFEDICYEPLLLPKCVNDDHMKALIYLMMGKECSTHEG